MKNISLAEFSAILSKLSAKNFMFGFLAILLMPFNWFLESFKWKKFVNIIQVNFKVLDAVKAVLIGVFFGFITPNRIGEFGGRLFKIDKGNKAKALNLSLIGGLAQFVVTLLVGISASFWFMINYFHYNELIYIGLVFLFFVILLIYFNFNKVVSSLLKFKLFKHFAQKYVFSFDLSIQFLLEILIITLFRYMVYVSQYVLVFLFLGIDLEPLFLAKTVSTMLLIQTIVPSFALLDIGIRGSVLLFLLSEHTDKQLVMLLAILLVWILNLVIPAIIGYLNLLNLKLEVKNEKSNNHICTNIG